MKILVVVKLVPDLVEELTIDDGGAALDTEWMRLIINEFDNHALEQALLLKDRHGGNLTVVTLESDDADGVLFSAVAKGADRVIRLAGDGTGDNNHALGRALAALAKSLEPDLVLTGVGAHNDLDGPVGPILAGLLDMPYVGYVAGAAATDGVVEVRKEYPGGLVAELSVQTPAVLGIQAAEQPPRYVAVSKIRQVMKTAEIEEVAAATADGTGAPSIARLYLPETGERAAMIDGDEEQVADKLVEIFRELGLV